MSLRMAAYACLMRRQGSSRVWSQSEDVTAARLKAGRMSFNPTLEKIQAQLKPARLNSLRERTSVPHGLTQCGHSCFLYLLSLSVGHYDNIAIKPIKLWININQNANSTPIQFHKYLKHLVHSHRNASIKKKNWIIRVWGLAVSGSNAEYSREEMCNSGSDGIK